MSCSRMHHGNCHRRPSHHVHCSRHWKADSGHPTHCVCVCVRGGGGRGVGLERGPRTEVACMERTDAWKGHMEHAGKIISGVEDMYRSQKADGHKISSSSWHLRTPMCTCEWIARRAVEHNSRKLGGLGDDPIMPYLSKLVWHKPGDGLAQHFRLEVEALHRRKDLPQGMGPADVGLPFQRQPACLQSHNPPKIYMPHVYHSRDSLRACIPHNPPVIYMPHVYLYIRVPAGTGPAANGVLAPSSTC